MTPREMTENFELQTLSPYAVKSADTKGRKIASEKCEMRTEFQRDRDKITHSKSFRRLMHKTQVFIAPEGDHYRTRLTHTLEVAQVSRTIARALRLNEDLTEAIALGHDLGHTPFGHTGEDALDEIAPDGFQHNTHSIRVAEELENGGKGLNLTHEVLDGIRHHRSGGTPSSLEGKIVQLSDKIAYINHDIDDAIRGGLLKADDLPGDCLAVLGKTSGERIDFLVTDVIHNSMGKNEVAQTRLAAGAMNDLRNFMFGTVYQNQLQMKERQKILHMFTEIHRHFTQNPREMPSEFQAMIARGSRPEAVVCDYIAGMTDRFALKTFSAIFMPHSWNLL